MIHPDTQVRYINDDIGYGIFATRFIPRGTIVYIKDPMEIEISAEAYRELSPEMQVVVEKYSYIDERGLRIISWDLAKYVNHCCHCNTMSTGYGFEIAIRDIQAGEEITDEYGMFNLEYEMEVQCSRKGCRRRISGRDLKTYYQEWDRKVSPTLNMISLVEQPLEPFIDRELLAELQDFLRTGEGYRSVLSLLHQPDKIEAAVLTANLYAGRNGAAPS